MTRTAVDVARASYEAFVREDRASIEALLAEDFHFTSPLDNRLNRSSFFERCWPNSKSLANFDFLRLTPHNDQVIVTYRATTVDGGKFQNTEILTILNGRITEVEVYFGWSIPHPAPPGGFTDRGSPPE
jgi:ketosteroid isomerase-like protein